MPDYFLDGTSMSSPHVAGVVALMAQKKADLTPSEAEAILEGTATPLPSWGAVAAGSGLLDAETALAVIP
jgi:serine protease